MQLFITNKGYKIYTQLIIIFTMEQDIRRNLAHNLRVERAKKELSQEKLAELANISTKHLTKIENEKVTPSVYMVYKLAKVLDTTIDNLCDNF